MQELRQIKIKDLKPYEKNTRTHSEEQIEELVKSIKEFGFKTPVLVDEGLNIIAGHARMQAAEIAGLESIPCFVSDEWKSEEHKKAFVITDNKLAEDGGWDMDLLKAELEELDQAGFDTTFTGFDIEEFQAVSTMDEMEQEEVVPEPPEEPTTKRGQIFKLGNHRLMCGDSTKIADVQKIVGGVPFRYWSLIHHTA